MSILIQTRLKLKKLFSSACSSDEELPDILHLNKEVNQIGSIEIESIENATS